MAILVDPKRKTHLESYNFLPALVNVHQSSSFDWATCILDDLACMCQQSQSDTKQKLDPCPAAGCLLLLNVHLITLSIIYYFILHVCF